MSVTNYWGVAYEELEDDAILKLVLSGEREPFACFVRRYGQRLYRVALSIVRDSAEAEDVVQDTFVSAFEHLRQFSGRAKFVTWLTRIAVNNALQRLSAHCREVSIPEEESDSHGFQLAGSAPSPEERASTMEAAEMLNRAVAALPESYREIVVLRDLHEMDTIAAARQLGISMENVKVRLHRARRALRRKLVVLMSPPHTALRRSQSRRTRCPNVDHAVQPAPGLRVWPTLPALVSAPHPAQGAISEVAMP